MEILLDSLIGSLEPQPTAPTVPADLDALAAALTALYEVQARLWSIPDKAEIMPGVTCEVKRTPLDRVALLLPPDVTAIEAVAPVIAARAVGVGRIVVCMERPKHLPEAVASMFQLMGVSVSCRCPDGVPVVALSSSESSGRGHISRPGPTVIFADNSTDLPRLVSHITFISEAAGAPVVVTTSASLACALPPELVAVDAARSLRIVLTTPDAIAWTISRLHPGLVITYTERNHTLIERALPHGATILRSPGPAAGADAASLLLLNAPNVPVSLFYRTTTAIIPLTAR